MLFGGGFELSLVFRACFVGALLDRGLGPPASTVAVLVFLAYFAGVHQLVNQLVHKLLNQLVNQLAS